MNSSWRGFIVDDSGTRKELLSKFCISFREYGTDSRLMCTRYLERIIRGNSSNLSC